MYNLISVLKSDHNWLSRTSPNNCKICVMCNVVPVLKSNQNWLNTTLPKKWPKIVKFVFMSRTFVRTKSDQNLLITARQNWPKHSEITGYLSN